MLTDWDIASTTFSIEFPLIDNNIRIFLAIMISLHFIILFYTKFHLFVMNLISAIFFPQIVRKLIYRLIWTIFSFDCKMFNMCLSCVHTAQYIQYLYYMYFIQYTKFEYNFIVIMILVSIAYIGICIFHGKIVYYNMNWVEWMKNHNQHQRHPLFRRIINELSIHSVCIVNQKLSILSLSFTFNKISKKKQSKRENQEKFEYDEILQFIDIF